MAVVRSLSVRRAAAPRKPADRVFAQRKAGLLEFVAARLRGNGLRFGSRVFSAVQRANPVDGTETLAVRLVLQEGTFVRQLATRPAISAPAFSSLGDGQYCGKSPFYLGGPGISCFISHNQSFPGLHSRSAYFTKLCPQFKGYFCAPD